MILLHCKVTVKCINNLMFSTLFRLKWSTMSFVFSSLTSSFSSAYQHYDDQDMGGMLEVGGGGGGGGRSRQGSGISQEHLLSVHDNDDHVNDNDDDNDNVNINVNVNVNVMVKSAGAPELRNVTDMADISV